MTEEKSRKKEIYTYEAPWTTYALAWSRRGTNQKFKLAVGSFKEEYSNQVHIIELERNDDGDGDFKLISQFDHPYPATKIMWSPSSFTDNEILATTGDYLRLWSANSDGHSCELKTVLNNNRHQEYCAPLTSFDWNDTDPSLLGVCSVDTTCTIWDVNKCTPKTQLIAHDKEVYDISFSSGAHVFGTVGADGSLRIFDLRSLEHSTILYETADQSPLLRVTWNRLNENLIATSNAKDSKTMIIDVRLPSVPCYELSAHHSAVNGIAWAPHSANHICTCSDDHDALIWELGQAPRNVDEPMLSYTAEGEINQLQWDKTQDRKSVV